MADETLDVESLASKIASALRRKPADPDTDSDDDLDEPSGRRGYVPVDRLRREVARRKDAEARLGELGQSLEQLQAGYKQQLEEVKATTGEEVKRIGLTHAEDLALVDHGLTDPLGRKTLRDAWGMAPKEARGKTPVEWWQQTVAAHRAHAADPETAEAPTVPRPLQPYLPAVETQDPPPQQRQQQRADPRPPGKAKAGFEGLDTSQGLDHLMGQLRKLEPGA